MPLSRPCTLVAPDKGKRDKAKTSSDPHDEHHLLSPVRRIPHSDSKRDSTPPKSGQTYVNVTVLGRTGDEVDRSKKGEFRRKSGKGGQNSLTRCSKVTDPQARFFAREYQPRTASRALTPATVQHDRDGVLRA
jgi:hypothetical protein